MRALGAGGWDAGAGAASVQQVVEQKGQWWYALCCCRRLEGSGVLGGCRKLRQVLQDVAQVTPSWCVLLL